MALRPLRGRDVELSQLLRLWERAAAGGPQLAILSGFRRVGKTFLLQHFLERVRPARAVYYAATMESQKVQLRELAARAAEPLAEAAPMAAAARFDSWRAALDVLVEEARREPLVVVLDEVPYLVETSGAFPSVLQHVWDELTSRAQACGLLLILTGSAISVMRQLTRSRGALHRRENLHLRLQPFTLLEAARFFPAAPPEVVVEAYAACGGYPLHLQAWDPEATAEENLAELAGRPGSALLTDAGALLRDLPQGSGYPRVLAAIGRGRTRYGQIADEADQRIETPLETLVTTGVVRRSTPVGSPRRAQPLYELADTYLRFWYSVIHPHEQLVEGGQGSAVLARSQQKWRKHVGWVFEEAARQHAIRAVQAGQLPSDTVVGRWWSTSREPVEIDLLGLRGSTTFLAGEASWSPSPPSDRDVRALDRKLERVPDVSADVQRWFYRRRAINRVGGARVFGARDVLRDW